MEYHSSLSSPGNEIQEVSSTESEIREESPREYITLDEYNRPGDYYEEFEDFHEVETLHDQVTQLNEHNWQLMRKVRDIETKRRIAKRSLPRRIKDRFVHWKKKAKYAKKVVSTWVKRKLNPEGYYPHAAIGDYRQTLAEKYYPRESSLTDPEEDEDEN